MSPLPEPHTLQHGHITRIEPYGIFVDLSGHVALVHISQIEYKRRTENVYDAGYRIGDRVVVFVLDVQPDRRKISASLAAVDQRSGALVEGYRISDGGRRRNAGYDDVGRLERDDQGRSAGEREFMSSFYDNRPKSGQNRKDWLKERAEKRLRTEIESPVWARSPSPPRKLTVQKREEQQQPTKIDKQKRRNRHDDSSESSNSSSSASSSSSSLVTDSRRRSRSRNRRSNRSRDLDRRRRGRSSRRHRSSRRRKHRRSYSTSSSSDSSSSNSDSSSTGTSSTNTPSSKLSQNSSSHENVRPPSQSPTKQEFNKEATERIEPMDLEDLREAQEFKKSIQKNIDGDESSDDDGPMPITEANEKGAGGNKHSKSYGKALLPGEGEALAQYVQQNLRIPRRGEIGYSTNEIEDWEKSGYVMSGSRHARMNAVRIRKENQIYSAEEQRALALITMEEKQQKEAALVQDFRTMLKERQAKIKDRPITEA